MEPTGDAPADDTDPILYDTMSEAVEETDGESGA